MSRCSTASRRWEKGTCLARPSSRTGWAVASAWATDRAAPVTPDYRGHFAADPAVLKRVLIEAQGRRQRQPAAEERAALAQQ